MGQSFDSITDAMETFVGTQHLFFVATAPSGDDGHVNLSPKGLENLRVLGPNRVAYLDLTGSGAETIAHVRQNGRITFMFCAFEGKPDIVRFYGTGQVHLPGTPGFDELRPLFGDYNFVRSIITADVSRTSSSCGFAVPLMEFAGDRQTLPKYFRNKDEEAVEAYWVEKNQTSIDGLAAVDTRS